MSQKGVDSIKECSDAQYYNSKSDPFISGIASVIGSLFLRRQAQIHVVIGLLFKIIFCAFKLGKPLFDFFRKNALALLFFQPFSFFFQFSLGFYAVQRNLRKSFFNISQKAIYIFFMFEVTLFFFSIFIYNYEIG